jgi:hypothetical protein
VFLRTLRPQHTFAHLTIHLLSFVFVICYFLQRIDLFSSVESGGFSHKSRPDLDQEQALQVKKTFSVSGKDLSAIAWAMMKRLTCIFRAALSSAGFPLLSMESLRGTGIVRAATELVCTLCT